VFETRTAGGNEKFAGSRFSIVGLQASRELFTVSGARLSWMMEVTPVITAAVAAPPHRIPQIATFGNAVEVARELQARYGLRNVYGFGLAPLGIDVVRPLGAHAAINFTTTAGGVLFNDIVPYGKSTRANFTVAPSLALQMRLPSRTTLSAGYALHHLSNMSFGDANPGLNSHLWYVRVGRATAPR
jgi:hypothetical protein